MNVNYAPNMVSVIIPVFNSEKYLTDTINSLLAQTYQNWEAIIVEDCSTDNSYIILENFQKLDNRIRVFRLDKNSGAAIARNFAIEKAVGRFIAFLDSDDIWLNDKLEKQVYFMLQNDIHFSCTEYRKINEEGIDLGLVVVPKLKSNYYDVLKNSPGNSTVMYDTDYLEKCYIPDIRKRNDYVMWLKMIKSAKIIYGMHEILTKHRVRDNSLSKNKWDLVSYQWYVYRKIEKLSLLKSIYFLGYQLFRTVRRSMGHSREGETDE